MSLFYRRSIQRMLDGCSHFLTEKQGSAFAATLNRNDEQSLHVQWEIATLFALGHIGSVQHELTIGGSNPDVSWTCKSTGETLVADVRTVSDSGLDEENPREFYRDELRRRVKAFGLNSDDFADYPQGDFDSEVYGDRKMRLKYPKISESHRLFSDDFYQFLRDVRQAPGNKRQCRILSKDIDVTISYIPRNTGYAGGNPSYTVYYSPTRNPLFGALIDKAKQLRKTKYSGPLGIILADGGCDGLKRHIGGGGNRTYRDFDVVNHFFGTTRSISFVATLYVDRERELFGRLGRKFVTGKLYKNPRARFQLSDLAAQEFQTLPRFLPQPKLDGPNAARHLKNGWDGPQRPWPPSVTLTTGSAMYEVTISARALLELLAGNLSQQQFAQMHDIWPLRGDMFKNLLERGFTIADAKFARLKEQDDDHIVMRFEPDVSAGPFSFSKAAPNSNGRTSEDTIDGS